MGGKDVTRTPEQRVDTISHLINELPFNKYEKFNRKFKI